MINDILKYFLIAAVMLMNLGVFSQAKISPKYSFDKPNWILKFADSLADSGDFYRAITEYKRSLFMFPRYEKNEWVKLQIGKLYYQGGRYPQAISALTPMTASLDSRIRNFSVNWLAQSYFENEDYVNSYRLFGEILEKTASKVKSRDYYIYRALAKVYTKDYLSAQKEFFQARNLSVEKNKKEYEQFLLPTIELVKKINANKDNIKSPALAAVLGVIPGLGSLYLGKWDDSLISLLIVGSTSYLAYKGFADGNDVQLGIFAGLASGFYAGSIYSGYRSAIKHNLLLGHKEIKEIKSNFNDFQINLRYKFSSKF